MKKKYYTVTVRRLLTWNCRIRAMHKEAAEAIAQNMTDDPANDDTLYEVICHESRDQKSQADNE